jgi:hypothetical protein
MTSKKLLVFLLAAAFALGALPCLRPAALQAADMESIAFAKEAPGVVFTVRIRGEFGNEAFMLREPERLVIDVSPIENIAAADQTEVNEGGVLRVRTGRFQADVARLVFDLDAPGVMYRIDRTAEGLKITFWKEGAGVPAPGAKPAAPAKPKVEPKLEPQAKPEEPAETPPSPATPPREKPAEKPADRPATIAAPVIAAAESERGFFASLGGGIGAFLSPESTVIRSFPINDREGTAESVYTPKLNTPAALSFGRYIRLQEISLKLGLDIEYWNFKSEGAHVFTVPHPFLADTDRTLEQANSFRSYFTAVTAFALARIYTNGTLTVAAGPEIGFASGKYRLLDTIDIADAPPYTEAELSIREVTYADTSASSLIAGFRAEFEYVLSAKLSLILDVKATYFSPEITELSKKIGLSQAGAIVGIQYNF